MTDFSRRFEKFYEYVHTRTHELLEHWRVHTNRRTVIIIIIVGTLANVAYLYAIRPPNTFPVGELVTIEPGQNDKQIAAELYNDGVIRSPLLFRVIAKVTGTGKQLHAGDYLFKEPKDIFAITHAISVGAFGLEPYRIRIPEGAISRDMANIFATVLPRFNKERFVEKAQPQEGYLFPDTYFFLPNATEDTVLQTMRDNFDTHLTEVQSEIDTFGKPLADVITMASIVEREARNYEDRRMIAGVLWRRIKQGMALQADATFRYINGKGTFELTTKDLKDESPYNTYTHKGLPPTPIGSPSLASIEATVTPIDKGYLFYMADNHGVTHYAKTYAQQKANERLYLGK